jgi:predicted  nucleic acid-binding Zn-ribbon protein
MAASDLNHFCQSESKIVELENEIRQWHSRAVEMTGNLANSMLENHDLREEQKLLKTRLAFLEDGLEQLRKLFKPSGNNVKPVNAQEFVQTVYRRVVKTIGEAPSADPKYRLYVTPEQL